MEGLRRHARWTASVSRRPCYLLDTNTLRFACFVEENGSGSTVLCGLLLSHEKYVGPDLVDYKAGGVAGFCGVRLLVEAGRN